MFLTGNGGRFGTNNHYFEEQNEAMNWIDRLRERWQVKSAFQVLIILLVFALTGSTVVFIKKPILSYLFNNQPMSLWASLIYYILILPIYNVILLLYGFIFGQFNFFWNFEKRLVRRIFGSKGNNQ